MAGLRRGAAAPTERAMVYGNRASLVGILTHARNRPRDSNRPCIVILNAGIVRKPGPGRLGVALARSIAQTGFDVFRFDFAGVGDSPVRSDGRDLSDGVVLDVRETMDHLQAMLGCGTFVLVGLCSGADNGMRAAEADSRVVGLAMLDPTIDRSRRWYWERARGLLSSWDFVRSIVLFQHPRIRQFAGLATPSEPEPEEKPELYQVTYSDRDDIARCLGRLLDRNVELFATFTGSWMFIYNYATQFYDVYPDLNFGEKLRLVHQPGARHTFDDRGDRQQLLDNLVDWSRRFA